MNVVRALCVRHTGTSRAKSAKKRSAAVTKRTDKIKIGMFIRPCGHHIASWREPGVMPNANQSLSHYVGITQTAERGLFDFVFSADSPGLIWFSTAVDLSKEIVERLDKPQ